MRPFTVHRGIAAPLRRSDVDTDQIIPVRFLTQSTRTGFADKLFHDWRAEPEFVLNTPPCDRATILVAGRDFGTGSSREYAVWALQDYGFRAVIAPRFGDIFRGNALTNGLLTVELRAPAVESIWQAVEGEPETQVEVDLVEQVVRVADDAFTFSIDDDTRHRLINGLDPIDVTMIHHQLIADFESRRRPALPTTTML